MGNDGGSIPTRRELVKEAARQPTTSEVRATQKETLAHRWRHCLISDLELSAPIVSDALGRLYNKDAIITHLLSVAGADDEDDDAKVARKDAEQKLKGVVTSIKDVVEVKFETDEGAWRCPITQKKLDESIRAVYIVPCGHAFSESAVNEIMGAAAKAAENDATEELEKPACLVCSSTYATNDIIPILPTNELDEARLSLRRQHLKEIGLTHSLSKASGSKKRKKAKDDAPAERNAKKQQKGSTTIQNTETAAIAAKVLKEQEQRNQNRKLVDADKKPREKAIWGKNNDFMTRGFTIPDKRG